MQTEYRVIVPAEHLLADCPVTEWQGGDWLAVSDLAEARKADVENCNADKRAIRAQVEEALRQYGAP